MRDEHRGAAKEGPCRATVILVPVTDPVPGWSPRVGTNPRGCRTPPKQHSLVESLVLDPALPEVFAGFWCRGKIGENNFLLLKEKDRVRGRAGAGAHPRDREWSRQSWRVALARTDPALEPFGISLEPPWHERWADVGSQLPLCSQPESQKNSRWCLLCVPAAARAVLAGRDDGNESGMTWG